MKIKNLMFFSLIIILLSNFSLSVLAQYYYNPTDVTQDIVDFLNSTADWLFGTTFVSINIIIYLVVTVILAIMFSDALLTFSPLSRRASIAVGILLAVVLVLLGIIQAIVAWLFVITATLGAFAMVASLFFVFVAYAVFHFAIFRLIKQVWNPTAANIETVKVGIKGLKEIGAEFKKTKK